jgi:hypothetical protein
MKPPRKSRKERSLEALQLRLEKAKVDGCLVGSRAIPVQRPVELFVTQLDPADKKLPAAPGGRVGKKKPSDAEVIQLERTKAAGGLIHHSSTIGKAARPTFIDQPKMPYKTLADNEGKKQQEETGV